MKVLVTGAAGFIGSYVVEALTSMGVDVVGIDNLNDYYEPQLKYDRLKRISHCRFKFIKADIIDREKLLNLFSTEKFTSVIHLAAQAGVRYSIKNPYSYIDTNILGFINILEGCRHHSISHLVYASSSSVYGLNKTIPFSEDDKVDKPASLYAATKKSNELMAHAYSSLYGLSTTGLRFFTVYGPMGRPDMAYFTFTKNILESKTIDVYNNGNMMRDFTYIDDIVVGIIGALYNPVPSTSPCLSSHDSVNNDIPYQILNIGNNKPINLGFFIECIENALGKKAIINHMPLQDGDVVSTYADIDKLHKVCGFKPSTRFEDGIENFVNWYKSYYS